MNSYTTRFRIKWYRCFRNIDHIKSGQRSQRLDGVHGGVGFITQPRWWGEGGGGEMGAGLVRALKVRSRILGKKGIKSIEKQTRSQGRLRGDMSASVSCTARV